MDYELDETSLQQQIERYGKGDPELVEKYQQKYKRHRESIEKQLEKMKAQMNNGLLGKDKIGLRVGKVLNQYKVGKHFELEIQDESFEFRLNDEKITREAALDGIYIIRTNMSKTQMAAEDTVRHYKNLSKVERAFRSFKSVDLKVRPIYHRSANRVRAHILLCMLAYYVQWHMMEAWRPLLFADEDQAQKKHRDPVDPPERSENAREKVTKKHLKDGTKVHSFKTLLMDLSTIVKNRCSVPGACPESDFILKTVPSQKQQQAFNLLKNIAL